MEEEKNITINTEEAVIHTEVEEPVAPQQPAEPQPEPQMAYQQQAEPQMTYQQQAGPQVAYQQPMYQQPNYQSAYRPVPPTYYTNPEPTPKVKKERKPMKPRSFAVLSILICLVVLSASIFGGVYFSSQLRNNDPENKMFRFAESESKAEPENRTVQQLQNSQYESIADIAEDVGKSVVTIVTTVEGVDQFYGAYSGEALGSGVIIGEQDDELYIATNYHVIEDASAVSVLIGDDDTAAITAHYKGSDSSNDLAVIYVKKSEISQEILSQIKIATLGSSDDVAIGDLVIAIGSPLDKEYSNTATAGVVSGLQRRVTFQNDDGTSQTLTLMQTDAAINPGNSGGALVNGRGEVIGINNAKLVDSTIEGMGFAIPMSTAKPILEELITKGKVVRPYLGITGNEITADSDFAAKYGLLSGVYVASVLEDGAAQKAGIQANDVIITFNGVSITSFEDLTGTIAKCEIGQEVEVEVIRGYMEGEARSEKLTVTIMERPGDHK